MSAAPEKLMTAAEIAEIYQVRPATVRAWQRAGKIPAAVAMGTIVRFSPRAVARALREESRREAQARAEGKPCPAMLPVI